MRVFVGRVSSGYGLATTNLMGVETEIEKRMGLAPLVSGTLNITLSNSYIVREDARIDLNEYDGREGVELQRCLMKEPGSGTLHKAIITRPESHEVNEQHHGTAHFEIMGLIHFRDCWNLEDGDRVEVQVEGDETWWQSGIGGYLE